MSEFDARMSDLRRRFVVRCVEDLAVLDAAGSCETKEAGGDCLRLAVHRMAGAAGTFGFPEIGALAGAIDDALIDHGRADPEDVRRLSEAIRTLAAKA